MPVKKSFFIVIRLIFVLYSLHFMKDAFFKWDGYAFYMRFIDFVPDLSLSFVIWTGLGIILAVASWIFAYGLSKIGQKFLTTFRIEHVISWMVLTVIIKKLSNLLIEKFSFTHIALSNFSLLIISGILTLAVIWFVRNYTEKILYEVNSRITPLVWLFAFLLVLSVPLSVFKKELSDNYTPPNGTYMIITDKKPPNIILVTWDALTSRDMQVYGYDRPTTPFISKWAKDASLFTRMYAEANFTTPTAMSLMTGQRVWTHRVWYQAFYHPVSNYENNLPRILKDYGYNVYGFVANVYAHPEILGIKDAFLVKEKAQTFSIPTGWWVDTLVERFIHRPVVKWWVFWESPHIIIRLLDYFRPALNTTLVPPEMVYNRFLEYISQSKQENKPHNPELPFFAWLHVLPPHDPYLPPEPYMGMFGDAEKFNTEQKQTKSRLTFGEYIPEKQKDVNILRKRYDEFILYSDKQLESFLTRLAKTIDMSNTVIIISSDHGESFKHGYRGHSGPHLYDSLVHIPLIIKIPWKTNNTVIDTPVEQIDIAPTILELAGIPVPEWMEGKSLLPLLNGKSIESRPLFSMQLIKNRVIGNPPITKGTIAVWEGDYKLIHYLKENKSLLFNLGKDPDELENLFDIEPEVGQHLLSLIHENLKKAKEKIKMEE